MKKVLFTSICILLIAISFTKAQENKNPYFGATTTPNVKVTKVEVTDTATILSMEESYNPKWWVSISDKTYIQSSNGGEKLYVKRASGLELNKSVHMPKTGVYQYQLFFPPINKQTSKIDLIERLWQIYDIEIVPETHISLIPENIQGNWLRTDGSNEWVYGFYKNLMIYKSEFWDKVMISQKKKTYQIQMLKNNKSETLYIEPLKNGNLMIGPDASKMELFSKTKTYKKDFLLKDDQDFSSPVFKKDTAIFKVYINGYHPKMGKTGKASIYDILAGEIKTVSFTVEPDGTLTARIPLLYPQILYLELLNFPINIFLEPGKTTLQYIDLLEQKAPIRSRLSHVLRERKSLYMGDCHKINSELQATDSICHYDFEKSLSIILDKDPETYKDYIVNDMKKKLLLAEKFFTENNVSQRARSIIIRKIKQEAFNSLLYYNNTKDLAYRNKNKIPDNKPSGLEKVNLSKEYYEFLQPEVFNDPLNLITGLPMYRLLGAVEILSFINPPFSYQFICLTDSLKANGVILSEKEDSLLHKLIVCKKESQMQIVKTADSATWKNFESKYGNILNSIGLTEAKAIRRKNLQNSFGLNSGFALDVFESRYACLFVNGYQKPLNETEIADVKSKITTNFILNNLLDFNENYNAAILKKKEENNKISVATVNETPKTEADKIFDSIISKFRGKIIFVDFWATWCSPCREGMATMKPMKEEFAGKDVVFLYITNESSPLESWKLLTPEIRGEHYRLTKEEWNIISGKFNISGIPHYALIDREGKVVTPKIYFNHSVDQFKKMINEQLNTKI